MFVFFSVLICCCVDSTTNVIQTCGIPLNCIDIVSNSVWFKPLPGTKTGQLYTGELETFLKNANPEKKYTGLILDFCNAAKGIVACLKLLFERKLIHDVSFWAVTGSYRGGSKRDHLKQDKVTVVQNIYALAEKNGYWACAYGEINNGDIYSVFFKIIRPMGALHEMKGLGKTVDGRDASNWVMAPPFGLSKLIENYNRGLPVTLQIAGPDDIIPIAPPTSKQKNVVNPPKRFREQNAAPPLSAPKKKKNKIWTLDVGEKVEVFDSVDRVYHTGIIKVKEKQFLIGFDVMDDMSVAKSNLFEPRNAVPNYKYENDMLVDVLCPKYRNGWFQGRIIGMECQRNKKTGYIIAWTGFPEWPSVAVTTDFLRPSLSS